MRFILPFFFFLSFLFAEGTYTGVHFTDQEENMTLLFVNHADYNTLYGVLRNSTKVNNILWYRYNNADEGGFTDIQQLVDLAIDYRYLNDLKLYSYKWTADIIINPEFGTTYPETNFLFALSGILIGFIVMFGFIRAVT